MADASNKLTPFKVKLMPEYAVNIPFWPRADSTDALIPKELLRRVELWQTDFENNFVPESGWKSDAAKIRWAQMARVLETDLREALRGVAELEVDLWPLLEEEDDGDVVANAVSDELRGALDRRRASTGSRFIGSADLAGRIRPQRPSDDLSPSRHRAVRDSRGRSGLG